MALISSQQKRELIFQPITSLLGRNKGSPLAAVEVGCKVQQPCWSVHDNTGETVSGGERASGRERDRAEESERDGERETTMEPLHEERERERERERG